MIHHEDSFCVVAARQGALLTRPKVRNDQHNQLVAELNDRVTIQDDCLYAVGERTIPIEIETYLKAVDGLAEELGVPEGTPLEPPVMQYKYRRKYVSESYLEHVESYTIRFQMNREQARLISLLSKKNLSRFTTVLYLEKDDKVRLQYIKEWK